MKPQPTQNACRLALAIAASRCLLHRWQFVVSHRGAVWLKPSAARIDPAGFAAILTRLRDCCDDRFPSVVMIDFRRAASEHQDFSPFIVVARRFAEEMMFECRLVGKADSPDRPFAMYLFRSAARGRHSFVHEHCHAI